MSKAQTDIRATSFDVLTANPNGYVGTIDDALAQIRAEDDIPPKAITARQELLGFLGANRSVYDMSGIQVPSGAAVLRRTLVACAIPEDDSVEYGAPVPSEPPFFSLENARARGWI